MKNRIGSKLLAYLLVFILLLSGAPFGAFATELDSDAVAEMEQISECGDDTPEISAADSTEPHSAQQNENEDSEDISVPSAPSTDVPATSESADETGEEPSTQESADDNGSSSDVNSDVTNEPTVSQSTDEMADSDDPSAADIAGNENSDYANVNDAGDDTANASEMTDDSAEDNGVAEADEGVSDTDDIGIEENTESDKTSDDDDETVDDNTETEPSFTAEIRIVVNEGQPVYMGETASLKVEVTGANYEYSIRWETHDPASDIEGEEPVWNPVGRGREYSFLATQAAVSLEYRVVVYAEQGETSKVVHITAIGRTEEASTEIGSETDINVDLSEDSTHGEEPSIDDATDENVTDQEDTSTDGDVGIDGDYEESISDIEDPAEENDTDENDDGDDILDNTDGEVIPSDSDADVEDDGAIDDGSSPDAVVPVDENAKDEKNTADGMDDMNNDSPEEPENPETDEYPEENLGSDFVDTAEDIENKETDGMDDGSESVEAGEDVEGVYDTAEVTAPKDIFIAGYFDYIQTYTPGGNKNNDELLTGYIEKLFGSANGQKRLRSVYSVGASLTGNDAEFYGTLKNMATAVANGSQTGTIYEENLEFGPWTADDLNVESLLVYDENEDEWYISGEAMNVAGSIISEQLSVNLDAVINALVSDCPYELYWYNKTINTEYSYDSQISCRYNYDLDDYVLTYSVQLVCTMPVAEEYQAGDQFHVDSSKAQYAQNAIENIQSILDGASGLTVRGKLEAFKTAICDLVTYNDAAADDNNHTPYGDPWQLVWVFDEDPDTNVVCEGYSKAFKYLCDQVGISCLLVTGQMTGATGAGPHMWNLVRLDGYSYLVDVTNSDAGTAGAGGELFMATVSSENDWNAYTINGVHYEYDEDTLATFSQEVLTVRRTNEEPNVEEYTVTFDPGDGSGEMEDDTVTGESIYQLPVCVFEAPADKQFKEWSVVIGTAAPVIKAPGDEIMVDADTTVTAIWEDLPVPEFKGHSILLTGQIGLQFFLELPEGKTASDYPGSYVTFEGNKVNSETHHALPTNPAEINGQVTDKYLFTVNLSSIQMADKVTPTFHYTEDGTAKTVTGEPYSVKDYIDWALNIGASYLNDQQSAIIPKLADYGHYAQIYLSRQNGWTIGTNYAEMTTYRTSSYDYAGVMNAASGYAFSRTQNTADVANVNYRLTFGSQITLTVRIEPAAGNDSLYIAANGASDTQSGIYRMITYPGVYANQLTDTHTIQAGDCTITVSPMSYVYEMLRNETVQNDAKDLMCALYGYAQACHR